MGPTTRSASRPKASSSKSTLDRDQSAHATHEPPPTESELEESKHSNPRFTLERLLKGALKEGKRIERENGTLRKKVAALEDKLARLQDSDNAPLRPKRTLRTSMSVAGLQGEVHKLKGQVRQLQKSKEKYRKKLHDLSLRELKSEANELVEDAEFEVGDSAYQMRKLLRSFHELMVANSLEEGSEECPICMESLRPKECRSLPCQHMFCNNCLSQLQPVPGGDRDTESISCPQCRKLCQRDELELVEYTATEQWDALLEVARQWARMDTRREADTSEEEEEEFLDDGENETSTAASEHMLSAVNPLETSPEPEQADNDVCRPEPRISPSRLRRRTVVETLRASPEPGSEPEPEPPKSSRVPHQEEEGHNPKPEQPDTPPPQAGPPMQIYAQTPRTAKRKMLEEMAAARSKKRRI